jgi:hypothetical protein
MESEIDISPALRIAPPLERERSERIGEEQKKAEEERNLYLVPS